MSRNDLSDTTHDRIAPPPQSESDETIPPARQRQANLQRYVRRLIVILVVESLIVVGTYFSVPFFNRIVASFFILPVAGLAVAYYLIRVMYLSIPRPWVATTAVVVLGPVLLFLGGISPYLITHFAIRGHAEEMKRRLGPVIRYIEQERKRTGTIPIDPFEAVKTVTAYGGHTCLVYSWDETQYSVLLRNITGLDTKPFLIERNGLIHYSSDRAWRIWFHEVRPLSKFQPKAYVEYCFDRETRQWHRRAP